MSALRTVRDLVERATGIDILRQHFYSPIPDHRRLPDALWSAPDCETPGLRVDREAMAARLTRWATRDGAETGRWPRDGTHGAGAYFVENGRFMSVDAHALYGTLRDARPRRVLEIGAGYSTLVSAKALAANANGADLVTVEPYPEPWVADVPGLSDLVRAPVQDVPLERFAELAAGDVLFIDSSHVAKAGSDVQYLVLRVLPRLAPGVLVHVHDVYLPYEYPKHWIADHRLFWNESYLMHAFLLHNEAWEVLWSSAVMAEERPALLRQAIPSYAQAPATHRPGSLWLRRTR